MPYNGPFFSHVKSTWNGYQSTLDKYAKVIPVPQKKYFDSIKSIDELTDVLVSPIVNPLWLAVNTLGFLCQAILSFVVSVPLAIGSLFLLAAPKADVTKYVHTAFKMTAAQTIVSAGMTVIAAFSTLVSPFLNLLNLLCRLGGTVVENIKSSVETCFGGSNLGYSY